MHQFFLFQHVRHPHTKNLFPICNELTGSTLWHSKIAVASKYNIKGMLNKLASYSL